MRIHADADRCVGAGQCVLTEPDVFDQNDEDGTVVLLADQAEGEVLVRVEEAVQLCPAQALSVGE
ncbi:ferredoxin [Amycolatopsis suaedae]|uniref:Ferredoxin n=1 Tax=Amycolatopsis suaedae TaxID=2510978 RepID=A0A4Q7JE57_9PSEU|nr:ferredoxin [Amycolatopsis suaedae]RZQ65737.1 ferredoxin [Amycolatopsis suaedae]